MTILDRIVTDVNSALSHRKRRVSLQQLQDEIEIQVPPKDFHASLTKPGIRVIAEIKNRSPSKGVLRSDFSVLDLMISYTVASAAAISVLTEEQHFGGSLNHLRIASRDSSVPIIRKDFIVDPYQIYEARASGADAILLIAAILDKNQLDELHSLATELKMASLVEVYDPVELEKIDFSRIKILGVNNRNLHTFKVDLNHSLRIFELIDDHITKVAESGMKSGQDLAYLHQRGVDAFLIGETLMRSKQPGLALTLLIAETEKLLEEASN